MIGKATNMPVSPRNPVVPLRLKGEFAFDDTCVSRGNLRVSDRIVIEQELR